MRHCASMHNNQDRGVQSLSTDTCKVASKDVAASQLGQSQTPTLHGCNHIALLQQSCIAMVDGGVPCSEGGKRKADDANEGTPNDTDLLINLITRCHGMQSSTCPLNLT